MSKEKQNIAMSADEFLKDFYASTPSLEEDIVTVMEEYAQHVLESQPKGLSEETIEDEVLRYTHSYDENGNKPSKEEVYGFIKGIEAFQSITQPQPKLSDEEINRESNSRYPTGEGVYASYVAFIKGAKWARDRVGGGVDLDRFF